jgi:hypothetical protein
LPIINQPSKHLAKRNDTVGMEGVRMHGSQSVQRGIGN